MDLLFHYKKLLQKEPQTLLLPSKLDHQVLKYRTWTDVEAKTRSEATPFQEREMWQLREQEQDYSQCAPNQH